MDNHQSGYWAYLRAFAAGLKPDPKLLVDEWAEANMVIPIASGAAEPGRYRVARTPYAREVMRALSPGHPARKVVVKAASQLLKTQVALNWICSLIDQAPANIILLEPTDKLAKRVSARFDKTVEAVPLLQEKVARKRSRNSKNTSDTKEFKGGTAWFLSARSASNLAEASARWLVVDEIDRLLRELKGEGDPVGLAEKRQTTYGKRAKGFYISTPTEEDASRIEELYREGNQQRFFIPCPHCGAMQTLEWENLQVDLAAGTARYLCPDCGCEIEEHAKTSMLDRGEWRATGPGNGETWSFEISALYAPLGWVSWLDLAREHAEAQEAYRIGDLEKMQVFFNTRLARCWTASSARIPPELLMQKAEAYPLGIAPQGAMVLTGAVDVQANRLELQVVGWGPGPTGLEAWIVATHVLYGDPTLPAVWEELDAILTTPVEHACGLALTIRAVCVDSGDGGSSQEVYEFVRPRKRRIINGSEQRVIATKGASQSGKPIVNRPTKIEYNYRGKQVTGGVNLWMIGTDTAKDWIYNRLALAHQIAIHTSNGLPLDFYAQLMAEAKVAYWVNGRRRQRYALIKRGTRNEQLDLLVYNLAAAHHLGIDRYTLEHWERAGRAFAAIPPKAAMASVPTPPPAAAMPPPRPAYRRNALGRSW